MGRSHRINIYQGIRQGGVLTTGHYKPHITIADDLAEKTDMVVWDAENGAGRERYCIHPAKSHTLLYKPGRKDDSELNVDRVDIKHQAAHLLGFKKICQANEVDGKITLGRKTAYSLMSAGFHRGNSLRAAQNGHV